MPHDAPPRARAYTSHGRTCIIGAVERTQISLTAEQARRLRGLASKRRTSMAALIREDVDRAYPPSDRVDERWSKALAAVGGFRSGASDVSLEHDRELGDAFDA